MRVGTPGFIAERLTEGREARAVSQTLLAELTGIKAQSISHYEQGRQSPSPEALSLLAAALQLPERFFLRPAPAFDSERIFFRQHGAACRVTARIARLKAARHLAWLKQIALYVRQYVDLPAVRLPQLSPLTAPFDANQIEQLADDTRVALGLNFGPAEDLIPILEANGWIVTQCQMDVELGGSYSHWDEGIPYLALCVAETRSSWVQYNVAHELGHVVLHRDVPVADHSEADRFARAFLLPARTFPDEVWAPGIDALVSLKKDWCCPVSVMLSRCGDLGLLKNDELRRAETNVVRRGWKTAEPKEIPEPEKPQLLARSLNLLLREGLKDRHALLTDLALSAADVEELCGLPQGFLLSPGQPVHAAALRLRRDVSELAGVDAPDVVITQI